jgi:hypothetical protein
MVDYSWPAAKDRKLIGQRISRLDGPAKVTGAAKYTYDLRFPGMLYARFVRCPHAHARITRLDTSAAQAMPGVKAIHVVQKEGAEIQWALDEIVAVAAVSEQVAEDAVRAVRVEYEVLPHFVTEERLADATNTRPPQEEVVGDPDGAMAAAPVKIKGTYGVPVVAHNRSPSGKATSSRRGAPPRRCPRSPVSSPKGSGSRPPACGSAPSTWAAASAASSRPTAGASSAPSCRARPARRSS